MNTRLHNQKGFTLLEIVVAFGILAIAIVPLGLMFMRGSRDAGNTEQLTRAVNLLDSEIERIKSLPFVDIQDSRRFFYKDALVLEQGLGDTAQPDPWEFKLEIQVQDTPGATTLDHLPSGPQTIAMQRKQATLTVFWRREMSPGNVQEKSYSARVVIHP